MNLISQSSGVLLSVLYRFKEWKRNLQRQQLKSLPNVPESPTFLGIEPTNICNANCVFCAYQYQERPRNFMSFETFKSALDQYIELGGGRLCLTPVVGDALIDPNLVEKVAYASQFSEITQIYLYTNAILLSRKKFEELIDAGVQEVVISMTSFNESEYQKIYRNSAYPKILKNLYEIAESDRFSKSQVTISFRSNNWFPQFQTDYKCLQNLGYKFERANLFDTWSGRIQQKDLPEFMFLRPLPQKTRPCHILYGGPTILADGTITACGCRDVNGNSELVLGNIQEMTLEQSWIDGKMDKLRQRFMEGNFPDVCQDCRHYLPMGE
jgi:MoaA/NifB/PqqE/SkfB family radical SAM enzyme